jgi:cell fate regulator YaaT (PSP1 superfamily)
MGLVGRFFQGAEAWRCGQRVVLKSDRGMETGTVVCGWGGCGAPAGISPQVKGDVLRPVSHADEVEERHLADSARRELQYCKDCIAARRLPMKLAAVEHLFGGDRIIFYFVSESRVDFRALVRDLAHEFQTRIEMRQIGVRDEARLLGDYERCGRPLCCRAWIKELEPVSMKMAKIQKATLDPTKISGRCGRLMCCLRFEHATYRDLARNLPRKNTMVLTAQGPGKVVDSDVVSQIVAVLLLSGARVNVPVESLRPMGAAAGGPPGGPGQVPPAEATGSAAEEAAEEDVPESRLASDRPRDDGPEPSAAPPAAEAPPPPPNEATPGHPPARAPQDRPHRNRRGRRRHRRGDRHRGRPPEGATGGGQGVPPPGPMQGQSPPPNRPDAGSPQGS